jgi:hypothetical protein
MADGLKGILESPIVKSLLLRKLKTAWKENNITAIVITEKNGELDFETYNEPMAIMTKKELKNIIEI